MDSRLLQLHRIVIDDTLFKVKAWNMLSCITADWHRTSNLIHHIVISHRFKSHLLNVCNDDLPGKRWSQQHASERLPALKCGSMSIYWCAEFLSGKLFLVSGEQESYTNVREYLWAPCSNPWRKSNCHLSPKGVFRSSWLKRCEEKWRNIVYVVSVVQSGMR